MQITRGVARREHLFPRNHIKPALVVTARRTPPMPADIINEGISVVSHRDIRWARCNIKSIALLPNVLAKQVANEQGSQET